MAPASMRSGTVAAWPAGEPTTIMLPRPSDQPPTAAPDKKSRRNDCIGNARTLGGGGAEARVLDAQFYKKALHLSGHPHKSPSASRILQEGSLQEVPSRRGPSKRGPSRSCRGQAGGESGGSGGKLGRGALCTGRLACGTLLEATLQEGALGAVTLQEGTL